MSVKCSVYVATSVDGYIAKPDGDIEWLHRRKYSGAVLNGLSYDDFIPTVDALVMGRNTFEKMLSFGSWPYHGTPVVVLSSRELDMPVQVFVFRRELRIRQGQERYCRNPCQL